MLTRLRFLPLLALFLLLAFTAARGQTTVYAGIDATQYSFRSNVDGNFNYDPSGSGYSYYKTGVGFEGGATWLIPSSSRLKAGIDGRFLGSPGSRGGNAAFASLRIAFVPHRNPLEPYFQIGGGYVHTHLPGQYVVSASNGTLVMLSQSSVTGGAADLAFGLNVRTGQHWLVRAIELGGYSGGKAGLGSIGFGVGYTLPSRH